MDIPHFVYHPGVPINYILNFLCSLTTAAALTHRAHSVQPSPPKGMADLLGIRLPHHSLGEGQGGLCGVPHRPGVVGHFINCLGI